MNRLFYQHEGTWFGDCMPLAKDGKYYLYHQRDERKPCPFGEPFGWSLVCTEDFVNYEDHGVVIQRGTDEDQDQFIFAGSVFEADGKGYAFYTGFNRNFEEQGRSAQVLMYAVSSDLIRWKKENETFALEPQPGYDPSDWRDPFVLIDDINDRYVLILGTRKAGCKTAQTGRTVYFTSKDLKDWDFQGDFWAPDMYTMHEMPDLFQIGDWWYHLVSEYSDRHKTIYRMGKSMYGPWEAPKDDAFDGRAYYAARTCENNGQRVLFGWVPTREQGEDTGNYEWAGTFVPHEIFQRADGSLGVKPPESLWRALNCKQKGGEECISGLEGRREKVLGKNCLDLFGIEMCIVLETKVRDFGICFYTDAEKQKGYRYHFYPQEQRVVFEKYPNFPWYSCMNIGLERPLHPENGKEYHIKLIVDDTVAVLYVNGTALSVRVCEKAGERISVFATNGVIRIKEISINKKNN